MSVSWGIEAVRHTSVGKADRVRMWIKSQCNGAGHLTSNILHQCYLGVRFPKDRTWIMLKWNRAWHSCKPIFWRESAVHPQFRPMKEALKHRAELKIGSQIPNTNAAPQTKSPNFGGIRNGTSVNPKQKSQLQLLLKHCKNCECCPVSQLIVR